MFKVPAFSNRQHGSLNNSLLSQDSQPMITFSNVRPALSADVPYLTALKKLTPEDIQANVEAHAQVLQDEQRIQRAKTRLLSSCLELDEELMSEYSGACHRVSDNQLSLASDSK